MIWRTYNNNLLRKGWAKNYNRWGKGSSEAGWVKKQPFKKRLDQKLQPMGEKVQAKQVGPKITTDGGKGSSEAGWAKKQPFKKRLDQKLQPMGEKVQAKQVGPKITTDGGKTWAKN